jgi:hypothetical protein
MKLTLTLLVFTLFFEMAAAQQEVNSFQLSVGPSWHGTGDLRGFAVGVTYEHDYTKRFSLANGLTTTIHYGKDQAFNSLFPGISPEERLMRFTTAGIQLHSLAGLAILSTADHKLKVDAGVILRFQSTSYPAAYSYYQDSTVFPEPFYVIYDIGKQNTLSPGYTFGLSYLTKISMQYQLGIKAFFQNDTNADAITGVSLTIGRLLPRLRQRRD